MRLTLLIVAAACVCGCRPTVRTGFTVDYDREGEHVSTPVDSRWDRVTLRHWTEDNRGNVKSKVVGEAKR